MATALIKGGIGADGPYWDALEAGRFVISRCAGCSKWMWPAHFRCGACGSWDLVWEAVEPQGTVYTWTLNHAVSDAVKERRADTPYVTLLVELPQAARVRVAGVLTGDRCGLHIGAQVRGIIRPADARSRGYTTMVWELSGNATNAGGAA